MQWLHMVLADVDMLHMSLKANSTRERYKHVCVRRAHAYEQAINP
jgi:hypothetical protein